MSHEKKFPKITKKSPSADQIAKMAQRANVKQLLLTHMRSHMDTEENHLQMSKELKNNFSGISRIAEDLMEINLT